jgi:hypothetical protein
VFRLIVPDLLDRARKYVADAGSGSPEAALALNVVGVELSRIRKYQTVQLWRRLKVEGRGHFFDGAQSIVECAMEA